LDGFSCKSLKGKGVRSGIRIIYAYYEEEDIIEFIEIYYNPIFKKTSDIIIL